MPSSRATARSDSPSAPVAASCRRASSLISLVSSARARSRAVAARGAVRGEVIGGSLPFRDHWPETRAVLLTAPLSIVFTDLNRDQCSHKGPALRNGAVTRRTAKMTATETRYIKPKSATNFFNETVARLTRMGVSVYGSRILYVRGRKSGEWRTTPVNPLTLADGERYLVAPRGNTQWVRNLRAVGTGELHIGRKVEP